MSPYVILAAVLAVVGAGWQGYRMGRDSVIAAQAKQDKLIQDVREAALEGAAQEIAKLRIVHTTIRQQAEKEIIREPIYTDCQHPESVRRLLDAALTQTPIESPGDRELPEAHPAQ